MGYRGPTLYELGEPLFEKEVANIIEDFQAHRDALKKIDCTIMIDK